MRHTLSTVLAVCLLLAAGAGRAEDRAGLQALIDRAIQARGDVAKQAQFQAATWKGKGTIYLGDQAFPFTGDWAVQPPAQSRVAIRADVNGMLLTRTVVVNHDQGWVRLNDNVEALDKEALAEGKEQLYANWVVTLLPLKDPAFQLAPLGEVQVGDRAAVGVTVSRKGHRDVQLFFDKEDGHLVKSATRVKDPQAGREVGQEVFYGAYQDVGEGLKRPLKTAIHRDGKRFLEAELSEYKPREKVEDKVFARP
jgi:hypothetical protein